MEPPKNVSSVDEWFTARRFALILALLIFASFPKVLLGLETFVVRDYGFFAYPIAHYFRESFWRGELPFWNPLNNCGLPLLAQWNTMVLYPPSLIYLLLPLDWSLSFFSLLHLFSAGLGMYFLVLRWTNHRLAASLAGLVFAFNGLSLNFLMWPSHIATYSWMPWVVLTVESGWRNGGRKLALAALVGALQMLAGGPETILMTWIFLFVLCVFAAFRKEQTPALLFFRFAAIVLLVAGLAAMQLLPFFELASHSQRETGYADARWAMPAWGWANFLVPMFYGAVWQMGVFFQSGQSWTSSYYVGTAVILLAVWSVWKIREPKIRLLFGVAVMVLLFSFGDQFFLYRVVRKVLPQISLITYPIKFVSLAVFIFPILAGFGIAHLRSGMVTKPLRSLAFVAGAIWLLITVVLVIAWQFPYSNENVSLTFYNGLYRALFLLFFCGSLVALLRARSFKAALGFTFLLLIMFWFDIKTHEPNQNPTVEKWVYQPGLAKTKLAMKPEPAPGRSRAMVTPFASEKFRQTIMADPKNNFLVKRLGFFADCNLLDNVPKVDGFFSLYPHEMEEFNTLIFTNGFTPSMLDCLAVSQITAPEKHFEWQAREKFLPMVTAGQKPVFVSATDSLSALADQKWNPATTVFLQKNESSFVTATNGSDARIVSSRFAPHRIEIETESTAPSLVVISQTFYPHWRATIDGNPTRILRANHAFQAVEVSSGRHKVELIYRDRSFYLGAIISSFSLAIVGILWRKNKSRPA